MKAELDKQLCEKYPKIFAQRHWAPSETCMCWGIAVGDGWYDIIDVLCGSIQWRIDNRLKDIERCEKWHKMRETAIAGDWTLFNEKHADYLENPKWAKWLEEERRSLIADEIPDWAKIPEPIPQVEAVQVKEKFGGLRFYINGGDKHIWALVDFAEAMSYRVCEICGKPGKTREGGWILTLCDEHHENRDWKDE